MPLFKKSDGVLGALHLDLTNPQKSVLLVMSVY